jgi:arylsulfatase I/J
VLRKDAVVVFHADNGGEILGAGVCGGNNWPLRGGKFSNWEGGIRVNAWVSGGRLPVARRGAVEHGLVAIADWYTTYCALAGVDATDHAAAAAGLPPVDGVDQWPLIAGAAGGHTGVAPPRTEVIIGDTTAITPNGDGKARVGGLINGTYKLLLGAPDKLYLVGQDVLTGPSWPNVSSHLVPMAHSRTCGRAAKKACLFDIFRDPTETMNLAEDPAHAGVFARMLARIDSLQAGCYSPDRGANDKRACAQLKANGDFWGPWLDR